MPARAFLDVDIQHRLGPLDLNVRFSTSAPWTVLFGPSGSGKSTLLRAIAGVFRPDRGRIVIGDTVVFDSERRIWLPPHRRPTRWAPQRAMLFPRTTVSSNMSLGTATTFPGRSAAETAGRAIQHFGLNDLAVRMPDQLSGGQRQLVGVARAAAGLREGMLLLDEPFTGLDAPVRNKLIVQLRSWLDGRPILSVTHDVGEAFLLRAHVLRLSAGLVVEQGPVEEVLGNDRTMLLEMLGVT